mgnify:FL=1
MNTGKLLALVRQRQPLVHHITNAVTISECANITLAAGGLPVMANAVEEVEEMVEQAQALVLNIGTLTREQVEAMLLAGKRANALQIPIVLDPVGVGATKMRLDVAKRLLAELKINVIKGNAAEIAILAGGRAKMLGVEAVAVSEDVELLAQNLARQSKAVVAVTGKVDLVTDGNELWEIHNGHVLMAKIVGTGCMTASVMGCFAAICHEYQQAAAAALVVLNVAAELAAERAKTPAAFKGELFDRLYALAPETVDCRQKLKIKEVQG